MREETAGRNKKVLLFLLMIWMVLIFVMSAMDDTRSSGLSGGVTHSLLNAFMPGYADMEAGRQAEAMERAGGVIRKLAHFGEYMVLGIIALLLMKASGMNGWKGFAIALIVCAAYAATDEIHQLFVPGRSGQAGDVLIDTAGSAAGCALVLLGSRIKAKKEDGIKRKEVAK